MVFLSMCRLSVRATYLSVPCACVRSLLVYVISKGAYVSCAVGSWDMCLVALGTSRFGCCCDVAVGCWEQEHTVVSEAIAPLVVIAVYGSSAGGTDCQDGGRTLLAHGLDEVAMR